MDDSPASSSQSLEIRVASSPAKVAPVRRQVEEFAGSCGFDARAAEDIGLCVNEALANVIRHAYDGEPHKPILISIRCDGESLEIAIRDWGNGIVPPQFHEEAYDPLTPGGVGLLCLRSLMDSVCFEPQRDGMLLKLAKRRRKTL